jgi:phosphomannomutase
MLDPGIFKAYDVRGLYGEQIDESVAYRLGGAFVELLAGAESKPQTATRVGLARDMRLSSPALSTSYAQGMLDAGADVVDIGEQATEVLYYLVGSQDLDGGIVCTASHNPKEYTGAKLVKRGAIALSGESGIGELQRLAASSASFSNKQRGRYSEVDAGPGFRDTVSSFIDGGQVAALKVVVDGGNGMAGPTVGPLLDKLPIDQVRTYWTPDGHFPDHEPNPLLEQNRQFVVQRVLAEKAHLGIAWDGDADRCFFIDDRGRFVDGDFLTALLAEIILAKEPKAAILYDVRASRAVSDTVQAAGGSAHINRVGHAFFKSRMRAMDAAFGGEVSGHYYFRDFYCADSGVLPALLVLELLSARGQPLSELVDRFRSRYFISGEINSTVTDQTDKMAQLAQLYADGEVSWLDGISVDYSDWHFNVRPSNTEPLLRLNLESLVSAEHMSVKRDELLDVIRS